MENDSRYYSVRPEWIWSEDNHELTKVAALRITLISLIENRLQKALDVWLNSIHATETKNHQYYMGGCALEINSQTPTEIIMTLSSGGQDALESLEYYTESFYQSVIAPNEYIAVIWEELPLYD